ncbi:MAG: hypothetical protein QN144_14875 [Armatimonadota bacterium]|nr:hypothetical protein [Armatimonadota bacterium]
MPKVGIAGWHGVRGSAGRGGAAQPARVRKAQVFQVAWSRPPGGVGAGPERAGRGQQAASSAPAEPGPRPGDPGTWTPPDPSSPPTWDHPPSQVPEWWPYPETWNPLPYWDWQRWGVPYARGTAEADVYIGALRAGLSPDTARSLAERGPTRENWYYLMLGSAEKPLSQMTPQELNRWWVDYFRSYRVVFGV